MIPRRIAWPMAVVLVLSSCLGETCTGLDDEKRTVTGTVYVNGVGRAGVRVSASDGDFDTTNDDGRYGVSTEDTEGLQISIEAVPGVTFRDTVQLLFSQDTVVDFVGYTNARVFGRVLIGASPIAGATVALNVSGTTGRTTTSGPGGEYEFADVPPTFAVAHSLNVTSDHPGSIFVSTDVQVHGEDVEVDIIGTPLANAPPTATILLPADGESYAVGTAIPFTGSATDPEDGTLTGNALTWTSSLDGAIGTGTSISFMLSTGEHTITLTATDSEEATGATSVMITVTEAAGTGIIRGTVAGNGNPVGDATVTLSGPVSRTTTTADSGTYIFRDLPTGPYSVLVSTSFNISFPANPQTANLEPGAELVVNFAGTY